MEMEHGCKAYTLLPVTMYLNVKVTFITIKGEAIPVQPWTVPEGSRRLRLPDFKTVGT
jgi:hypothetical protein